MSPSLDWQISKQDGRTRYQWTDGKAEAAVWKDSDGWRMHLSVDDGAPLHVDLGNDADLVTALERADGVIEATYGNEQVKAWSGHELLELAEMDNPEQTHTVAESDLANLVNLANEIEDVTDEERASLERLTRQLGRGQSQSDELDLGY